MNCKKYLALVFTLSQVLLALEAGAQCPGPSQRTALLNLQRANVLGGTRAGQIALTDTCGNQRYVRQVQINLDTINYIPAQTGNTANLSEFVFDTLGGLWYIDWKGDAIELQEGGATCDQDWLEISDASCPDAITDSIYHQKYAAIGARYVWPGATLLVNDSSSVNGALMVVQGDRAVKIALYDLANGSWSMLHANGTDLAAYVPNDGSFQITTSTGTPETATADVQHFQVNTLDSTVTINQYPNTRRDTQTVANFLYTDDLGTIRSQSVDSLPYPAQVNIYTDNGTILEERIVNINPDFGGLLTFQTVFPTNSNLSIGDSVVYCNTSSTSYVSHWETIPTYCEMYTATTGGHAAYIRTAFRAAEIYTGKSSGNSQIIVDSIGIKLKTLTSFGTTGQVLRHNGTYAEWQDTTPAPASVNIYNSDGTISTNRTVTLSDTVLWDIASAAGAFQIEGLNNSYFRQSDNAIVTGTGGASFNLGSGTPIAMSISLDAGTSRITDNRAGKVGMEYGSAGYGADFTDSTLVHRRYVGEMISDSLATIPGGGDVLQGGNSFGASMVIGTNDQNTLSLETNTVTRSTITGGASTGGAWTNTDVTSNTNTVETMFTNVVNSSGTAATGLGLRHVYALESSTTNGQTAAAHDVVWSDAENATRTGDFVFSTVANGAALAELFRMGGTNYALTATASVSNTNTVADRFTIRTNSSGTAAASFGGGILFQGESTTTDNQDMARISSYWTTATHASREAVFSVETGNSAGAISEVFRVGCDFSNLGGITIGNSSKLTISTSNFTPAGAYTISNSGGTLTLGGSTSAVNISNTGTGNIGIHNTVNSATSTAGIVIGNATSFTQTSGTRDYINVNYSFAPTSGTAINNGLVFSGTLNQTGGANGVVRDIFLNRTVTAVSDYRGIEIAYSNSNAKGVYQSGANTTNNFVGGTMFGSTSAPASVAAIEVSSTTKGILFPRMTTAQRDAITAVQGLAIFNTTTTKLEVYDGTTWQACW